MNQHRNDASGESPQSPAEPSGQGLEGGQTAAPGQMAAPEPSAALVQMPISERVPTASEALAADGRDPEGDEPLAERDRQAQPVDSELPPNLPFPVVGVGASAGGIEAFSQLLSAMPADSGMAFVLVQHLPPDRESMMPEILARRTQMPVRTVEDQMRVEANHVYVIRPGHTLTLRGGRLHLTRQIDRQMRGRPIDDFFKSLAEDQRERAIGIILSGMGSNGSAGAQAIKAVGGLCIAEDPETAQFPSMPRHLIDAGWADYILRTQDMPEVLQSYANHPYARDGRNGATRLLSREQQHFREILALLRTRTRQDFSGYKKPTLLRRVQRRMGLNRIVDVGEYTRLLRQSPPEVTALADDLLIHVTGFFRDPQAWEVLRERVIVPLIETRETNAAVRCWVTACSSGEEAYSLAMLLIEECERVGKRLDLKVFATDMAHRTLQNARQGIFPGGIEAEITPQRLERFFHREDAAYRVRQELREHVIFAPQNVLQDPPFSRLDVVSCRNLLIYLEPAVQQRVLSLMHFGLRDGGTLFLGSSETVAGHENLFEPLDKRARLFTRIGPTRHGSVDFPLPGPQRGVGEPRMTSYEARALPRPSLSQLTLQSLLADHTPAAVTVDRDTRIVFFHGDTDRFLAQPRGEPTRDLLSMARVGLRAAIRAALHQAASSGTASTADDCLLDLGPGERHRVAVTASPLDPKSTPDHFVVSFCDLGPQVINEVEPASSLARTNGEDPQHELRRVHGELQSAVEELQTSNEELKASHEEVVSINEELQSSNEELETSREEMQSLNEELATVNAQLHAKMEEYQNASNDLASLLASTDIAVLFLDTHFRIRRFTPPLRLLLDVIQSDVGRPLSDLARKFTDPDLLADAQATLDRLIPTEREISSEGDRWYLRRITPYRTADNRIDGVVVTFVDITARRTAEEDLRNSDRRLRMAVEAAGMGFWSWDVRDETVEWEPQHNRLLGLPPEQLAGTPQQMLDVVHPDDRVALDAAVQKAATEQSDFAAEFRVIHPDGQVRWIAGFGRSHGPADDLRVIGGVLDITRQKESDAERDELLEHAQAAREEAELANHVKDEFLATLSHELRTPLSSILLWSKLLGDTAEGGSEVAEGLDAIRTSAEAQRVLIDDLLDTARITAGKLRLEMVPTDLSPVLGETIDALQPAADAKGITINRQLDAGGTRVEADANRMRQVFWNLLSNAIKFTPDGGLVTAAIAVRRDHLELTVADSGRGIGKSFLPHVFTPFRQAEETSTRTQGGLGLGLAIVQRLVELHGGSVTAQSAGADQGATFIVRLPRGKALTQK